MISRLEICQKIYTTGFLRQKFYALKVRKLRLFLLKRNSINALISVIWVDFLLKFIFVENFNSFSAKSHLAGVNLVVLCKLCEKLRCFLGKFTQLAQILHDRWLQRSRQISTLMISVSYNGVAAIDEVQIQPTLSQSDDRITIRFLISCNRINDNRLNSIWLNFLPNTAARRSIYQNDER